MYTSISGIDAVGTYLFSSEKSTATTAPSNNKDTHDELSHQDGIWYYTSGSYITPTSTRTRTTHTHRPTQKQQHLN